MTKSLRKAIVGSLACAGLLAATTLASAAHASNPARDEVPAGSGLKANANSSRQPSPGTHAGAKVPLRKFPHTLGGPTILHDNGPLVTHPGGGFGGADASTLQGSLGMTILGFGTAIAANISLADDFAVPAGDTWQIDTLTVYVYQTGSTTTSTITDVRVQIWDGPPNAGGVVVFGDLTTNRLASTTFSNTYRVTETTMLNNQRPAMEVVATINTSLGEGDYWVEWRTAGTLASGPFAPPVTVLGSTGTGNGLQFNAGAWVALTDVGPQDMPFVLEGSSGGNAAIALTKTVGTVPAVCATTDSISVATGTTVYYCYSAENTGAVTFEFHDLVDDQLGVLLNNFPQTMDPGDTIEFIQSDTANATVTNTGTWTGSDSAGSYVLDSTIPFNFQDIAATGTAIVLADDEVSAAVPIGFPFTFFGAVYSNAFVSSNGFLTFLAGQPNGCCSGVSIPTVDPPNAHVSAWWEDLLPPGGGEIDFQTLGAAPNRIFIVQFTNVPHFGGGPPVTFQTKLFETTNVIEVHYPNPATDGGNHVAGVENESGTVGVEFFEGTTPLPASEAVRYTPEQVEEASASDTATVTIADPDIDLTPTSLSSTLGPDEQETLPLDIDNLGTGDLDWSFEEAPPAPRVSIPASDGNFPRGKHPDSQGLAPMSQQRSVPAVGPQQYPFGTTAAYSWNSQAGMYYTVFDLGAPEVLPNVAPFPSGGFIGAGEYVDGLVYMVDTLNTMWEVDPATGAILDTFTATAPPGGETYSGMALDPTSGTVYAGSTNITNSTLFTMDVTTGAATVVGSITNCPGLIALAIDGNGDLWGYDIVTDVLLSIDKTTGAGTVVGPIGFDANFGQGMGYDPASDTVYMAAFNGGAFQAELRSVDTATGNTTLVGVLGSTDPGGLNQLSWLGLEIGLGPCSAPSDLPWVSVDPTSGTTPPAGTSTVDVTFDSTGLTPGTYDGFLCVNSNDPDEDLVEFPVQLVVDTMPFLDGFETGDTSRWSFALP